MLFRLTAAPDVGLGHFVRCRALAEANANRGGRNVLAAEAMEPWVESWAAELFAREIVGAADGPGLSAVRWRSMLGRTVADVVVFDHYEIMAETHRAVAECGAVTVCVDDVPSRRLDAMVVVNQNVGVSPEAYAGLVPPAAEVLIGPRYALVGRGVRDAPRVPRAGVLEIVVAFGGGAHRSIAEDVLTALGRLEPGRDVPHLHITVVARDVDAVKWRRAGQHPVDVEPLAPGLGRVFASADLAIGAPGSTTYERLVLGVPSVLVQLSDNQEPVARGLAAAGAAMVLGRRDDVTVERWVDALRRVCNDAQWRSDTAAAGRCLVDGRGADRVLDVVASVATRSPAA